MKKLLLFLLLSCIIITPTYAKQTYREKRAVQNVREQTKMKEKAIKRVQLKKQMQELDVESLAKSYLKKSYPTPFERAFACVNLNHEFEIVHENKIIDINHHSTYYSFNTNDFVIIDVASADKFLVLNETNETLYLTTDKLDYIHGTSSIYPCYRWLKCKTCGDNKTRYVLYVPEKYCFKELNSIAEPAKNAISMDINININ